jgi:cytochrome P450
MKDVVGMERWTAGLEMMPSYCYNSSFFDCWKRNATLSRLRTIGAGGGQEGGSFAAVSLLVTTAIVVITVVVILVKRYRTYRMLVVHAKLPTVFWRPKFVNLNLHRLHEESSKKLSDATITNILPRMQRLKGPYGMYGTVYGLSTAVIHVAHGVPATAILQSTTTKTPAYDHFFNFCGRGVFTADGADWKAKRAAVVHALIRRHQDIAPFAERAAEEIVAQLRMLSPNDTRDIVPILQTATVQLIYRFITRTELRLGQDQETITNESSSLQRYLQSITRIRMIILAQSRSIWFVLPRWCYRSFSSLYRSEEDTMGPIRALARQACRDAAPDSPLYALQQQPLYQIGTNALDEAITLLFAGQDTSAATLSWTLYLLSQHPTVQQKLVDELLVCCDSSSNVKKQKRQPRQDQQQQHRMAYLDAVIKESMRLYPVAPFVVRQLEQDVIVLPGNHRLPAGAIACIWIYSLHRNPDHWDQPDQFIPERWYEATPKQSYMPFATGPRNCVGQPLANVVVRLILARLIREFDVQDDSSGQNANKRMQAGFTVLPQDGLKLRFVPRPRTTLASRQ